MSEDRKEIETEEVKEEKEKKPLDKNKAALFGIIGILAIIAIIVIAAFFMLISSVQADTNTSVWTNDTNTARVNNLGKALLSKNNQSKYKYYAWHSYKVYLIINIYLLFYSLLLLKLHAYVAIFQRHT